MNRPLQQPSASSLVGSRGSGVLLPGPGSASLAVSWHDVVDSVKDVRKVVAEMVDVGVPPDADTLVGACFRGPHAGRVVLLLGLSAVCAS